MTAPVPPEVVAAGEQQEAVARAIGEEWCTPLPWDRLSLVTQNECRRLAAAAIAALPPSPAEEALRRALADLTEAVSRGDEYGLPEAYRAARAALASPAPAPQGGGISHWCAHSIHTTCGVPDCACACHAPQSAELPQCNLSICPEGDGDHRITTGRCIVAPAPQGEEGQR